MCTSLCEVLTIERVMNYKLTYESHQAKLIKAKRSLYCDENRWSLCKTDSALYKNVKLYYNYPRSLM